MALSLPGNRLIYLSRDNLNPESFERIISPYAAWQHAEKDYRYDDRWYHSRYIVNIDLKSDGPYSSASSQYGSQAKAQLERMIQRGEVVCLNDVSVLPASLFYIDDNGVLICRDKTAFLFDGARRIIKEFNLAVSRRDYRHSGGKPAPTSSRQLRVGDSQPVTYGTLNSKNVGRLLAAGGIYNGNVEGFRKTAEQLGGDAAAGYSQVLNETTKGMAIAGASIAAGFGIGQLNTAREIEALSGQSDINKIKIASDSERRVYLNEKFGRTGDINRDINIRSNKETVRNFMQGSGITKERTIEQYMDGINLNEKVSVESINKGKLAYQNQVPGNWQGNWYSLNENIPPTKLGINPEGNLHGTEIKVSKVTTTYQSQQPVKMLRSTANPIIGTWSVPKEPFQTEGDGIQWFSTHKDAWSPKK